MKLGPIFFLLKGLSRTQHAYILDRIDIDTYLYRYRKFQKKTRRLNNLNRSIFVLDPQLILWILRIGIFF